MSNVNLGRDRQQIYALTRGEVALQLTEAAQAEAERYVEEGRVINPAIAQATLHALVRESAREAHAVEFTVEDGELYIGCTCEDSALGVCAHVGAVLLAWVQEPTSFEGYDEAYATGLVDPFQFDTDLTQEYREVLAQQTINELRAIAHRRNVQIQGTRKAPIVQELTAQLCDIQATRTQVEALSDLGQQLLAYLHLILGPGYGFTSENIISMLRRRHTNLSRRVIHEQLVDLAQQGLLLTFKRENLAYYMLPQVVRVTLPPQSGFVPLYPAGNLDALEVRERAATTPIQSLYAVWDYIGEQRPRETEARARVPVEDQWPQLSEWDHVPEEVDTLVRRKRTPYNLYNVSIGVPAPSYRLRNADRHRLRARSAHDDEETEFYYALLKELGAISAEPGRTIAAAETLFERLLSLPPSVQMLAMLHAWIHTTAWSEMDVLRRSANEIHVRRNLAYSSYKPPDLYREWRAGRLTVLRFMSTVEEGRWVSIEGFLKVIYEVHPDLIHAHSDPATWWLESTRTHKQFGTTYEDWQESGGRYVLAVLEGPLYWLGAVSLGYREGKPVAFRVTPVGSFALHRRTAIAETAPRAIPPGAIELQEDLTVILVPGYVPAQFHDLLHIIGELEETTPQRFVYRITAEGVLLALEQGQTIDSLLDRFSQWCNVEIPPSWREKMSAWSENYGKLHVYDDISLIELADDYALQELLSNTSLRDHLVYQFSPRLVAVRPEAIDALVAEMEKRGYTPHVE